MRFRTIPPSKRYLQGALYHPAGGAGTGLLLAESGRYVKLHIAALPGPKPRSVYRLFLVGLDRNTHGQWTGLFEPLFGEKRQRSSPDVVGAERADYMVR